MVRRMTTLEELKSLVEQEPFQLFLVKLRGGCEIFVADPEAVAFPFGKKWDVVIRLESNKRLAFKVGAVREIIEMRMLELPDDSL
jgi:hypothetical protein